MSLITENLYYEYMDEHAAQFSSGNICKERLNEKYLKVISRLKKITLKKSSNKPKAFIFTHQLIHHTHAPTLWAIDISYMLKKIYGDVTIIISPQGLNGEFKFNQLYNKIGYQNIKKDHFKKHNWHSNKIYFFPFTSNIETVKNHLIDILGIAKNDLIISIGAAIPYFDILETNKKILFATVNLPLPTTANLMTRISGYTYKNLQGKLMPNLDLATTPFDSFLDKIKPKKAFEIINKAKHNIKKDHFNICISGNRLDSDLNHKNIELIKRIIEINNVSVHFVGSLAAIPNGLEKTYYHPPQNNLQEFYNLFDMVLNIYREGNGTQGFFALVQEKILVSPPNNDFSIFTPKELTYKNNDEAIYLISKIKNDDDFRKKMLASVLQLKQKQNHALQERILRTKKIFKETLYSETLL